MSYSFATTAHLTCAACTNPYAADLWLIVDTVERNCWLSIQQEIVS